MASFPPGVHVVVPTPFVESGRLDPVSLVGQIRWLRANRAVGVVLLGTTSETNSLTLDEMESAVQLASKASGEMFVTVGVGWSDVTKCLDFAHRVEAMADGFMVTVPPYVRASQRGMIAHFTRFADELPKHPVMVYNIPKRTGSNMTPETLMAISAKSLNVCAIKEASGDLMQASKMRDLVTKVNPEFRLFSGDDGNFVGMLGVGGSGLVSVAGNLLLEPLQQMQTLVETDRTDVALELMEKYRPLVEALFLPEEPNPVGVKAVLDQLGRFRTPTMRLPLTEMLEANRRFLLNTFDRVEASFKSPLRFHAPIGDPKDGAPLRFHAPIRDPKDGAPLRFHAPIRDPKDGARKRTRIE